MRSVKIPKIRSLRLKIIAPLVTLSLLGSLLGAAIIARMYESHLHQQVTTRASEIATAIARAAGTLGDTAALRQIVASLEAESDVDLILVVLGESRRVVASTDFGLVRFQVDQLPGHAEPEAMAGVIESGQRHINHDSEHARLVYATPIARRGAAETDGKVVGAVTVVLGTSETERNIQEIVWGTIGQIIAGVSALYIIAFAALRKAVLLPLSRVRQALERRREGDLTARAEVLSHDEIGDLAENLNDMLDVLSQHERQLKAQMLQAKEAEAWALFNQGRLKAVIDTTVDGVIIIDAMGQVEAYNPACRKMFGYTAEEVLG